jgi:hypothetical protein
MKVQWRTLRQAQGKAKWHNGATVQRRNGAMAQRRNGVTAQWRNGKMSQNYSGKTISTSMCCLINMFL